MIKEEKLAAKQAKIEAKLKKKAENAASWKALWEVMTSSQVNETRVTVIKRLKKWQHNGVKNAPGMLTEIAEKAPYPQDRCEAALYIEDCVLKGKIFASDIRAALLHPLTTDAYDPEAWVDCSRISKTDLIADTQIDERFRFSLAWSLKSDAQKASLIRTDEYFSPYIRCVLTDSVKDPKIKKEILKKDIESVVRSTDPALMKDRYRHIAGWFNTVGSAFTYDTLMSLDDPELVYRLFYMLKPRDPRLTKYYLLRFDRFDKKVFEEYDGAQEDYAELAASAKNANVRKSAIGMLDRRSESSLLTLAQKGSRDALDRLLTVRKGKYGEQFYDKLSYAQKVEEICAGGLPEHRMDFIRVLISRMDGSYDIETARSTGKDLARIYRAYQSSPNSPVCALYSGIIGKTYQKHFDYGSECTGGSYDEMKEFRFYTNLS